MGDVWEGKQKRAKWGLLLKLSHFQAKRKQQHQSSVLSRGQDTSSGQFAMGHRHRGAAPERSKTKNQPMVQARLGQERLASAFERIEVHFS